ncbi:hypothetical protein COCON_G00108440 [Conger conger]|uniref:Uncharacterized protein n=1 Tax=Conger conger TaxID=82655 RepID=A0A9Q1DJ43_CONCO|nr:hypothetical protein COCON_G00108440 [Conger conger]
MQMLCGRDMVLLKEMTGGVKRLCRAFEVRRAAEDFQEGAGDWQSSRGQRGRMVRHAFSIQREDLAPARLIEMKAGEDEFVKSLNLLTKGQPPPPRPCNIHPLLCTSLSSVPLLNVRPRRAMFLNTADFSVRRRPGN